MTRMTQNPHLVRPPTSRAKAVAWAAIAAHRRARQGRLNELGTARYAAVRAQELGISIEVYCNLGAEGLEL